jgi:hypothetical protein
MNLDDQIARAKTLFESGKRVQELIAKRDQLRADLAGVDEELVKLLGGPATNGSGRAAQKCSKCGEVGHTKRTCTKGGE